MRTKSYPEAEQTLEALKRLSAETRFVGFDTIFEEVKRIRLERNLKANPVNLLGRVCRSLYFDRQTAVTRDTEQSKLLSIATRFPYKVIPRNVLSIDDKGLAKREDVMSNSYMLVSK